MMENLNDKKWKKIKAFGQGNPLQITTTSSSIDSIRLINEADKEIPYVTRTDTNNGIAQYVSSKNLNFGYDSAECITVGLDTQTAFWQPHDFVTGQNIQVVTGEVLSEEIAQFIIPLLRSQMQAKFNWGGNGATLGRMKALELMIPTTDSGEPDYNYMTAYVQTQRKALLEKYKAYAEQRIEELGDFVNTLSLDEKAWRSFQVREIANVYSGHDIYAQERMDGSTPLVTAVGTNNGIGYFVGNENDSRDTGAISVVRNGASVGKAFYHKYSALYGNDCRRIKLKHTNSEFANLFIAQVIGMQSNAFSYSRKLGTERLSNLRIMLPVDEEGTPDYPYMEQYAKNMMLRKYKQYLAYLDSKKSIK